MSMRTETVYVGNGTGAFEQAEMVKSVIEEYTTKGYEQRKTQNYINGWSSWELIFDKPADKDSECCVFINQADKAEMYL